jgi:photosystem II stability/assembly factor-like uncharacterized protein
MILGLRFSRLISGARSQGWLSVALFLSCASVMSGCGSSQPNAKNMGDAGSSSGSSSGGGNASAGSGGSGAGSNNGGSPGAGGKETIPPVILPPVACDGLSGKVGIWEEISPEQLRNPRNTETMTVVVNPEDGTVYATGSNYTNNAACPVSECPVNRTGVLMSSDCGATFKRVNSDAEGSDSAKLNTGAIWAMQIHPQQPQILYAANGYGNDPTIYKSVDAGETWRKLDTGLGFAQSIAVDAANGDHIAATFHEDCKPPNQPWCFGRSVDGGNSWTLFDGPPSITSGWTEGASMNIIGKTAYVVVSANTIWYTGDIGQTWTQLSTDAVYAPYPGSHAVANGNLLLPGGNSILMSPPDPDSDPPFALAKGVKPEPIPDSPKVAAFVTAGDVVVAGGGGLVMRPLHTAPTSDPTTWTRGEQDICGATSGVCRGPNQLAYDPIHKVVYSANWGAGLWRYVLE